MARHVKQKKKGRSAAWLILGIACLAAFTLGYFLSTSGISFL